MWGVVKSLVFTVVVPGTVTVLVPYWMLRSDPNLSVVGFRVIGVLPMALGGVFYFWCLWDFTFSGRGTPAPIDPPKVLVAKGLYRVVRNPMYLGVLLILSGEAIFFRSWTLLRYALALALAFHLFVVYYEEPTLRRKFGPAYQAYCQLVPRWMPRTIRNIPKPG